MTRDEAVARIKMRLGFYTKKDAEIVTELQVSQEELEDGLKLPAPMQGIFKPWFLVSEVQSAVTQIGEDRVPFPTAVAGVHAGFAAELENAALWILDPEAEADDPWLQLEKLPFDDLQAKWAGSDMPRGYAVTGVYFRLRPIPDEEYTLKIISNNKDVFPASGSQTNKWLTYAPAVLWSHAGFTLATALRDATASQYFERKFVESSQALYLTSEERLHTNQKYVMGGED